MHICYPTHSYLVTELAAQDLFRLLSTKLDKVHLKSLLEEKNNKINPAKF